MPVLATALPVSILLASTVGLNHPVQVDANGCRYKTWSTTEGKTLTLSVTKGNNAFAFEVPSNILPLKNGINYDLSKTLGLAPRATSTIKYRNGVAELYYKANTDFMDSKTLRLTIDPALEHPKRVSWSLWIGIVPLGFGSCSFE